MFARRTQWDLEKNPLTLALDQMRAEGRTYLDLTSSNPTTCGIIYDAAAILNALSKPENLRYEPDALGSMHARAALAAKYKLDPHRMMITASTSEAYSFLARLLCDPGEQWLVPRPSYPLFEMLAQIGDVELVPYDLFYDEDWHIDVHTVERSLTRRTRALVVVNPNNPTGNYVAKPELCHMERICAQHGMALVADEVFLDFPVEGATKMQSCLGRRECLTFVLSGLSKTAALPQMKLAWMTVDGPAELVDSALQRLEVIADAYLSVGAPVQNAIEELLITADGVQRQIIGRCRENISLIRELLAGTAVSLLRVDAGWSGVLRVPVRGMDEELALELLQIEGVLMHPGHFYDFGREGYLVVSLLTPVERMREGISKLLRVCEHYTSNMR